MAGRHNQACQQQAFRTRGKAVSPAATSLNKAWGLANHMTLWEGSAKGRDGPVTARSNNDALTGPSRRRGNMSTGTATAGDAPAAASQRTKPYAWLVLAMLAFIYIFNFLDRQLMSTVIESIKKDTGFTDAQMGLMTGFYFAIVYTTFGVVVGFLADRTSRRNILFAGAVLWSGFTALCGMAHNYPTMLAARVGVGVGEAAGAPPSYSIISDYFPAEKRGLALALFSMGVPIGQAAAIAFGAQIDIHWGWRNAFIAIGIAGAIAALMMLFVVREPKRGA